MKLSKKGYQFICDHEGVRNKAYQDSIKKYTIGIGFTTINGKPVTKGMYLTNEQIEAEFFKQIVTYENIVNEAVAVVLTQSKFDALVSFVFNVGGGNFRNSTLLKIINTDSSNPAIKVEFQKWSKAGGKVIQGLLNRRIDEAELYFSEIKQ